MPRKSEATRPPKERKITTGAEGAKRPEAVADKRSRMPQKSEATEQWKERKITTGAEGAKRPEALADKRSRMPWKSERKKQPDRIAVRPGCTIPYY